MLNVSNLCKRFGEQVVLDRFSLSVPVNGFTVLVGPSGCGKSTLFDVLTGVVPKDHGVITWNGDAVAHVGSLAAYMQQKDLLLPWCSLMENALLPARIARRRDADSRATAKTLFSRLGLTGFEHHLPREVSGGMRQRCALVRTLMFDRQLVLLDEPLSALDAITRTQLQSLLGLLQETFGKSLLMITHDVEEALLLADDVLVLGQSPMRVMEHYHLDRPKPRRITDPDLLGIKEHVLSRLKAGTT